MKLFKYACEEAKSLWNKFNLRLFKIGNALAYDTNHLYSSSFHYYPLYNKFDFFIDLLNHSSIAYWTAIAFGELLEKFLKELCDETIELVDLYVNNDKDGVKWLFVFRANDLISLMKQGKVPIYKVIKEKGADEEVFEEYLEGNENLDKEDIRNDIVNIIKDTIKKDD